MNLTSLTDLVKLSAAQISRLGDDDLQKAHQLLNSETDRITRPADGRLIHTADRNALPRLKAVKGFMKKELDLRDQRRDVPAFDGMTEDAMMAKLRVTQTSALLPYEPARNFWQETLNIIREQPGEGEMGHRYDDASHMYVGVKGAAPGQQAVAG